MCFFIELFPIASERCQAFLRHKSALISPETIRKHGITIHQVSIRSGNELK